jgi:hypothetical protein
MGVAPETRQLSPEEELQSGRSERAAILGLTP